jgi:hypothetical protein
VFRQASFCLGAKSDGFRNWKFRVTYSCDWAVVAELRRKCMHLFLASYIQNTVVASEMRKARMVSARALGWRVIGYEEIRNVSGIKKVGHRNEALSRPLT